MDTLKDWTKITVETEDGKLLATITAENILVEDGMVVRMTPKYEK